MVSTNMTLKVYVASISAATDIKKHTQKLLMVLDGQHLPYQLIDIASPGHEADRQFLRSNCKTRPGRNIPLPPQVFNEEIYCGDYEDFENAAEMNDLNSFFKIEPPAKEQLQTSVTEEAVMENGDQLTHDDLTTAETLPFDQESGQKSFEEEEVVVEEENVAELRQTEDLEDRPVEQEELGDVEDEEIKVESEIVDVSPEELVVKAVRPTEESVVEEKNSPEDVDVEVEENLEDEMVIHEEEEGDDVDPGESQLEDVVEEDEENLEEN